MPYAADDVELLLPSFRPIAKDLLLLMRADGYDPVPRDTLRSPEEAVDNAARGTGIKDSMHCYGCAMDVICNVHGWSCAQKGCKFFEALGIAAESLGLVWGGRWPRRDMPHVQCVRLADQKKIRAMSSAEERDKFVSAWLRSKNGGK